MAISQIVQNSLSSTISLGAKISSVQVANSTYVVKDDTAVNTGGGYIVVTGTGFQSNCQVLIGSTVATSVTYVSSTTIYAQVPAASAGSYPVYVVNGDGGTGIRVNGLTYSADPVWSTSSPLAEQSVDTSFSITLSAPDATSYVVQTGSSLPSGVTLAANGLLSGTVTGLENDTTYNFTIEAIDAEAQESPKAFSVTVTAGEAATAQTVSLIIDSTIDNATNNPTLTDISGTSKTITLTSGNPTVSSFTPYAPTSWAGFFDGGTSIYKTSSSAATFGTGAFTIECWVYARSFSTYHYIFDSRTLDYNGVWLYYYNGSIFTGQQADVSWSNTTLQTGRWYHIAVNNDGSNNLELFVNGVSKGVITSQTLNVTGNRWTVGGRYSDQHYWDGYISNFRVVKGSRVYSSAFTPPTSKLTAITNTSLLILQDGAILDRSTNAAYNFSYSRTDYGPIMQPFGPFKKTAKYSPASHGTSYRLNGKDTDDRITVTGSSDFDLTGDFTVECWMYNDGKMGGSSFTGGGYDLAVLGIQPDGGTQGLRITNESGFTGLLISGSGTTYCFITSSINVRAGQWYHVAMTRSGSTVTLWVNGQSAGTATTSGWAGSSLPFYIGNARNYGSGEKYYLKGYICDVRVVKGTAVYTSAFSVPSAPLTAISNTKLLAAHNSQAMGIYDATNALEYITSGDAKVSTTQYKYGNTSIYFDGTGDRLTCNVYQRNDMTNLAHDFTVEGWFRPTNQNGNWQVLAKKCDDATWASVGWTLALNQSNGVRFRLGDFYIDTSGVTISNNTWYHIAAVRNGSSVNVYIDGTSRASGTAANTTYDGSTSAYPMTLGAGNDATYAYTGYIDEFRISKFARYTGNFTPRASAWPRQ